QPLVENLEAALLDAAHARGVLLHLAAELGDGADDLLLGRPRGELAVLVLELEEVEVRVEQAVDLVEVGVEHALARVGELREVVADGLLEVAVADVPLLVFLGEGAEDLAVARRLVALGGAAAADEPLVAVRAGDDAEV